MKKTTKATKRRHARGRVAAETAGRTSGRTIAPAAGRTAQVSELKAGLSAYLARVKTGEEIIVTERGRPVARLVPIPRTADHELERLRDMERRGLIKLGTGTIPPEFWNMPRPEDPGDGVLKALLEEREHGR
jgi:prevent-host-death family protein